MTVILSDEALTHLLEAHASMAAWYYQMAEVLRDANLGVSAPTEQQRRGYIEQLAAHYPEIAAVAANITAPRPYVPPPIIAAPSMVKENEGVNVPPPPADLITTPAMVRPDSAQPQAPASVAPPAADTPTGAAASAAAGPADASNVPPPPAIVNPGAVKYD